MLLLVSFKALLKLIILLIFVLLSIFCKKKYVMKNAIDLYAPLPQLINQKGKKEPYSCRA